MSPLPSLLIVGGLFTATLAFSQTQRSLYVEDVLKSAAKEARVVVHDARIAHRDSSDPGTIRKAGTIVFEKCVFPDFVSINSLNADTVIFRNCTGDLVALMDASVSNLTFYQTSIETLDIGTFHIDDTLRRADFGEISMIGSTAKNFNALLTRIEDSFIDAGSISLKSCGIGRMRTSRLTENFEMTDCDANSVYVSGSVEGLLVERTRFVNELVLQNLIVTGLTKITGSHFGRYLTFNDVAMSVENIELPFKQLAHGKLRVASSNAFFDPELGGLLEMHDLITPDSLILNKVGDTQRFLSTDSMYFHSSLFDALVYNYQRLFNSYRARGDIESANACYVELKELDRSRLRFQHKENPSFKSFFRLQLSNLLKAYTEHGTDPAKAITVSVWVILAFATFYFFFPSDWDTTSKTKMIQNYKDLIEKNEKGYVKPFLKLVSGFSLSFINALTLSLNSFTTLGFGNIPTHGLARYVCVLQGFIGWFLLSIFTVALINQALF